MTLFNSCKTERFIYNGACSIRVSRCLQEELAWAIDKQDKQFQFTISYYTIPLETYKEAIARLAISTVQFNYNITLSCAIMLVNTWLHGKASMCYGMILHGSRP